MLGQFQKEFWTRFSIPLSRLDSAAIRRMRNQIPAHYNVFDQFDRSIVSIDTLKQDSQICAALEQSNWDLIIIDEAHNAAKRVRGGGNLSLRSKLAKLLSRKADLFGDIDDVEVTVLSALCTFGQVPAVDPVGVDDDPAFGCLPEHLSQTRDRHAPRIDDVGQHLPRPNRWQLVHVPDEQQCCV